MKGLGFCAVRGEQKFSGGFEHAPRGSSRLMLTRGIAWKFKGDLPHRLRNLRTNGAGGVVIEIEGGGGQGCYFDLDENTDRINLTDMNK